MKNIKKITGSYGDSVVLHTDGYVGTKYCEFRKVKSVDFGKREVILFGVSETLDFSRISYSCTKNQGNKDYISELENYFKSIELKKGSKFTYLNTNYEVVNIIYPAIKTNSFIPQIELLNENGETIIKDIDDFTEFQRSINVTFIPYTLEEKLINLIEENSRFNDKILENKEKFVKMILAEIQNA